MVIGVVAVPAALTSIDQPPEPVIVVPVPFTVAPPDKTSSGGVALSIALKFAGYAFVLAKCTDCAAATASAVAAHADFVPLFVKPAMPTIATAVRMPTTTM